jgi:hypothetical protein
MQLLHANLKDKNPTIFVSYVFPNSQLPNQDECNHTELTMCMHVDLFCAKHPDIARVRTGASETA